MNILEHLKQTKIFGLNILGIDVSITNGALTMFLAGALVFVFFLIVGRRAKLIPSPVQSIAEYLIGFVSEEMLGPLRGRGEIFLPFLVTIFSFIFVCNLMGIIPGLLPPTSNINVTATLAAIVFLTTHAVGIGKHGLFGYLKNIVPAGLPLPVAIFLFPIEIVAQMARPFSLAIRLFANMFAGHTVILVLISLIFVFKNYLVVPFPVIGGVAILSFEIFVAAIQAFIFTYLSSSYIVGALQEGH